MRKSLDSILLFQKVVPSYRVPVFRSLYKKYKIIVCHSYERKGSSWASFYEHMDYPNILMKRIFYRNRDTAVIQNILPVLIKYKPVIVISELSFGYITFWLLLLLKPIFRYRLAVWTHGIDNKDMLNPFSTLKSRVALYIYKHVDGVLLYSHGRRRIISEKTGNDANLFVAANTLDTGLFESIYRQCEQAGTQKIQNELGFKEEYHLIFIGRLLQNKRIDLLLAAFELIADAFDVGLHFIGDGPELNIIRNAQKKNKSIYIHGALYDEEQIGRYLYASDMMVTPGKIGLAIIHAFSYGLPVISCPSAPGGPYHSPEIEYLEHGKNGLLCESTAESLADNISVLLNNQDKLENMSKQATDTAYRQCALDNMLSGFEALLNHMDIE